MRYRKKPVEIEAIRIDDDTDRGGLDPNSASIAAVSGWMLGHEFYDFHVYGDRSPFGVAIETLEGTMIADPGDYVIRGVQGEFYPCKPDIFEMTYEEAQ